MKFAIITAIGVVAILLAVAFIRPEQRIPITDVQDTLPTTTIPTPTIAFTKPPETSIIPLQKHVFQTFNNCGPATLSMALSYYGFDVSQQELGNKLRPFQNPIGDNDDKSVTLAEVAEEAKMYGLIPFLRPDGDIEKLKLFLANGFPVITRTWLYENEDIGHYRIIRGFDDTTQELIQDDSLQAKDSRYSYEQFMTLWKPFNYEYLVLVPKEKETVALAILSDEADERIAWQHSLQRIENELQTDPNNPHHLFNLAINHYYLGNYQQSVDAYEKAEPYLTFRRLWYQIEPILAYQKLKNNSRVFAITDRILNNQNRAFSELYQIRGEMHLQEGQNEQARQEFEKALYYNQNFQKAKDALAKLTEM